MTATEAAEDPAVLHRWSARKLPPIVLVYVLLVFFAFILAAWFAFHSVTGVRALAIAAVSYGVAMVPGLMTRIEYLADERGIRQRMLRSKPGPFQERFRWDELDRAVAVKEGFRYTKRLDDRNPVRRLWKRHFSDAYSGEVHAEGADRAVVLAIVEGRGVAMRGAVESAG